MGVDAGEYVRRGETLHTTTQHECHKRTVSSTVGRYITLLHMS